MSLADQLQKVKLKPAIEPMKDYSDAKKCGFIAIKEFEDYQNAVLDVNTELWLDVLADVTFPTLCCPIERQEAKLFISLFERLYRNLDSVGISQLDWREHMTSEELKIVISMKRRLSEAMSRFTSDDGYAFVKTSCRSPKDAPLAQSKFKELYKHHLAKADDIDRPSENTQITCLLQAGFEAMKVKTADEVMDMMMRSERIYQDMLLAIELEDRFCEHFVIRKFVNIDVDMEFRGFVFGNKLVALSQYNYLIFSKRLLEQRDELSTLIREFFSDQVMTRLQSAKNFPDNFIIDFAVCEKGKKVWMIEINPFLETTDGGLFSWQHERHVLEGEQGFVFRVVEREKPGAKVMLPLSIKSLLQ